MALPGGGVIRPILRPRVPIVRPQDLVALELELHNLKLDGEGANLVRSSPGDAFLILHFPPQHLFEEAFFEAAPPGYDTKPLENDKLPVDQTKDLGVPVRALLSGRSRLVFAVPDGTPPIPYTLEGILAACSTLGLSVAENAPPPPRRIEIVRPVVTRPARLGQASAYIAQIREQLQRRSVAYLRA